MFFKLLLHLFCFQHVLVLAPCVNDCGHIKLETRFLLLSLSPQLLVFPKTSCDLCGTRATSHMFCVPSFLINCGSRTAISAQNRESSVLTQKVKDANIWVRCLNTFVVIEFEAKNKLPNRLKWSNVDITTWAGTSIRQEPHRPYCEHIGTSCKERRKPACFSRWWGPFREDVAPVSLWKWL